MQSNVVGALPWQECAIEPGCFATIQTFLGNKAKPGDFQDRPSAKKHNYGIETKGHGSSA